MTLQLHYHPLASFCWKALIALYENDTPFEPVIVDFADPASAAAFKAVWPLAKMPVLQDDARGKTIAESTVVIDYLDSFYSGRIRLLPLDPDGAWRTRMWDRVFDNYIQIPLQKIVLDGFRPAGRADPFGVVQAREQIQDIYPLAEKELGSRRWMTGDDFTLADCSAAPALFYANIVAPIADEHRSLKAYLGRLMARPSFARVLREAAPYFGLFPFESELKARYPELAISED